MSVPPDLMEKYFREELQLILFILFELCHESHAVHFKDNVIRRNMSVSDVNEHMHSLLLKSLMIFLHQLKR